MDLYIKRMVLTFASSISLWASSVGCMPAGAGDVRTVVAEASADGLGLVALRVRYRDREEPFIVRQNHAFLIDWATDPRQRHLCVYDRPRGLVQVTGDFDAFLGCIKALPAGSKVAWLDTCGAPISYGMTDEDRGRLAAAMAAGNKTYVPADDETGESNYLIVCTCESIGLRFPGE